MFSRRAALRRGFGALTLGLARRFGWPAAARADQSPFRRPARNSSPTRACSCGSFRHLRRAARPLGDKVFFVIQVNCTLPAVETCLLEAEHFPARVAARL